MGGLRRVGVVVWVGSRPRRLMSFHKAADAPSNSIKSLALLPPDGVMKSCALVTSGNMEDFSSFFSTIFLSFFSPPGTPWKIPVMFPLIPGSDGGPPHHPPSSSGGNGLAQIDYQTRSGQIIWLPLVNPPPPPPRPKKHNYLNHHGAPPHFPTPLPLTC